FFSSRRRHTRWPRDWSSDVCSSDLKNQRTRLHDRDEHSEHSHAPPVTLNPRFRLSPGTVLLPSPFSGSIALLRQQQALVLLGTEIGRASCRERVEIWVGAGLLKNKI